MHCLAQHRTVAKAYDCHQGICLAHTDQTLISYVFSCDNHRNIHNDGLKDLRPENNPDQDNLSSDSQTVFLKCHL